MTAAIGMTRMTFALDCPDATALATFYAGLLDWRISSASSDSDWVEVHPNTAGASTQFLAFQQVANYRAPEWPDGDIPQQAHLDFYVSDLAVAAEAAEAAGATRHRVQPSQSGSFIVFVDPAGHLFCLCRDAS